MLPTPATLPTTITHTHAHSASFLTVNGPTSSRLLFSNRFSQAKLEHRATTTALLSMLQCYFEISDARRSLSFRPPARPPALPPPTRDCCFQAILQLPCRRDILG